MLRVFEILITGILKQDFEGELPEWSNGTDSKSVVPYGVPGVRIPHSPQNQSLANIAGLFYFPVASNLFASEGEILSWLQITLQIILSNSE